MLPSLHHSLTPTLLSILSSLSPIVATVVPDVPNVEVPEDNGTVTVCFNTTTGIATPLIQQVTAVQKTTGNIATGE